MKIALVGYGKMGHELEALIKGSVIHDLVSISLKNRGDLIDIDGIKQADVVIDYTSADVVVSTIEQVSSLGKKMVIGTTGWYDQLDKITEIVNQANTGLIYGQNFSIGVNLFYKIVSQASRMFNKFEGYDVYGLEVHHKEKSDSPSGTAKKLAAIVMENYPNKTTLLNSAIERKIENHEFNLVSVRAGFNSGYHEIVFDGLADEIKLSHSARSRRGFAEGTLKAAEFILDKTGVHTFDELFSKV